MPVNSFENYPMSWKPDKKQLVPPMYRLIASLLEYDILKKIFYKSCEYLEITVSTIFKKSMSVLKMNKNLCTEELMNK
jgi:hypothetical protein